MAEDFDNVEQASETGAPEVKQYANQKDYEAYLAKQNGNNPSADVETPSQTPTEEPQQQTTVNPAELIQKELGYAPEVIKERLSTYESIAQERERLARELEEVKAKPSYLTEAGRKVDEYLSKGVNLATIQKFDGLNVEALSPEQRVKLQLEVQNPAWKPEHIDAYYNSKYATDPDNLDPSANMLKEAQLLQDDAAAKGFLSQYVVDKLNPAPVADANAAMQQKAKELAGQWQGQMPVLTNAMTELKQEVTSKAWGAKGEEDKASAFTLPLSEQNRTEIWNAAVNAAISNGVTPTAEGIQHVKELANKIAWSTYGPQMVEAALKRQSEELIASFKQSINNPVAVGNATPRQNAPTEKTREDAWRER